MKISMLDPSLFTGRYDDALCDAIGRAANTVTLHARPMRGTDAIAPANYRYERRFFRLSEHLRGSVGEGAPFRALKAGDYLASALFGDLSALTASDVVHLQWLPFPAADATMLRRLLAVPGRPALVHTVHNASAFHGDGGSQGRGYRALLDRFDALIVHGETTRAALLAQGVGSDRLHVVPHPPMALAQAGVEDLASVSAPLRPRVLFFGTIRLYKGFDLLIEACLALWLSGVDFELAVAGKPFMDVAPLLDRVRKEGFADRLLTDLGFLTEPRLDAHLRKADILVFPYRDIDSSGAFLSALHYGKAVVASRVGMFAGLDERGVALVDPGDSEALGNMLERLLADEGRRRALGNGALAMHAELGTWDEAAGTTLAVYEEAIRRGGAE
ncbi:MAG: glycosyltransferase family 4 protein [Sphingobium sp.]